MLRPVRYTASARVALAPPTGSTMERAPPPQQQELHDRTRGVDRRDRERASRARERSKSASRSFRQEKEKIRAEDQRCGPAARQERRKNYGVLRRSAGRDGRTAAVRGDASVPSRSLGEVGATQGRGRVIPAGILPVEAVGRVAQQVDVEAPDVRHARESRALSTSRNAMSRVGLSTRRSEPPRQALERRVVSSTRGKENKRLPETWKTEKEHEAAMRRLKVQENLRKLEDARRAALTLSKARTRSAAPISDQAVVASRHARTGAELEVVCRMGDKCGNANDENCWTQVQHEVTSLEERTRLVDGLVRRAEEQAAVLGIDVGEAFGTRYDRIAPQLPRREHDRVLVRQEVLATIDGLTNTLAGVESTIDGLMVCLAGDDGDDRGVRQVVGGGIDDGQNCDADVIDSRGGASSGTAGKVLQEFPVLWAEGCPNTSRERVTASRKAAKKLLEAAVTATSAESDAMVRLCSDFPGHDNEQRCLEQSRIKSALVDRLVYFYADENRPLYTDDEEEEYAIYPLWGAMFDFIAEVNPKILFKMFETSNEPDMSSSPQGSLALPTIDEDMPVSWGAVPVPEVEEDKPGMKGPPAESMAAADADGGARGRVSRARRGTDGARQMAVSWREYAAGNMSNATYWWLFCPLLLEALGMVGVAQADYRFERPGSWGPYVAQLRDGLAKEQNTSLLSEMRCKYDGTAGRRYIVARDQVRLLEECGGNLGQVLQLWIGQVRVGSLSAVEDLPSLS